MISAELLSHSIVVLGAGSTTCRSPVLERAIVTLWRDSGSCRLWVVSAIGATIALVAIVNAYVPGAYVKLHGPPRDVRADGAGATDGGNVGCDGIVLGLFAGTGSGAGGADTHAVTKTAPNTLAMPFSFIIGP